MTRMGITMRRMVRVSSSVHWTGLNFKLRPVRMAAKTTPVPAAESQLMTNLAASGFAFNGATGGTRITRLWSAGMSQKGMERVPPNAEPRKEPLTLMDANTLLRAVFQLGMPQAAQQRIRIAHGSHAYAVSAKVYLYFPSSGCCVTVPGSLPAEAAAAA